MNQRVHNLAKWTWVPEGQTLYFNNPKRRTVRLDVNCPGDVCFYVLQSAEDIAENPEREVDEAAGRKPFREGNFALPNPERDREVTFLALVRGRDLLEFAVDGAFGLTPEGGGASIYTADSQDIATYVTAPVILTKIANRRQRNPHLEMIEYQMRLNQQRFLAQLEAESARRIEAVEKRLESYAGQRVTGDAAGTVGAPQSGVQDDQHPQGAAGKASPAGGKGKGPGGTGDAAPTVGDGGTKAKSPA